MGLSDALPAALLVQVTIRPYRGESGRGPAYGPSSTVPAVWDEGRRIVRTPTSARLEAAGAVFVDPDVDCPPESLVTVPGGAEYKAVAVARLAAALPVDHLEITLA